MSSQHRSVGPARSGGTLFVQDEPVVEEWLATRRQRGLDRNDEVWEGVYHVVPHEHGRNGMLIGQLSALLLPAARTAGLTTGGSFNLGHPGDFRVPDWGFHRDATPRLYFPTTALVIEVLSPGDETFAKFGFYAARDVEETWVVDPPAHRVRIWQREGAGWTETGHSELLHLTAAAVGEEITWPQG